MPKRRRSLTPQLDRNFTIRLSPDMRERLEHEADERGLSVSLIVREALEEHWTRRAGDAGRMGQAGTERVTLGREAP